MSIRPRFARSGLVAAFVLSLVAPALVRADGGGQPPPPTSGSPAWNTPPDAKMTKEDADKVRAVELYTQAYRETEKAKGELADAAKLKAAGEADPKAAKKAADKATSGQKRLERARDKFAEVTTLDPKNADGWNMLGYTRRKTGDRKGAFDAYWKCLAIKPEHFGAHEYMGEAYLEDGKLAEARAELTWLKKKGNMTTLETTNLENAINQWVAANPEAASKSVIGETASTPAPATAAPTTATGTAAAAADSTK
jgi:tetratricopeptide (TPR) repeat protein